MRSFLVSFTLIVFGMSPAAFGGGFNAADIYKNTYISIKKGADTATVFSNLMASTKASGLNIKEVIEAAVAKGYMSQEQMNTVLDLAAKNAHLANDKNLVAKVKASKFTQADLTKIQNALQGQVTGAAYSCDRYGCYHHHYDPTVAIIVILVVILVCAPIVVVVY